MSAALQSALLTVASLGVLLLLLRRKKSNATSASLGVSALDLIGNTPLVHLRSLSAATGCEILAKAEYLNPGGSSKDRIALAIVREAEDAGRLKPGGTLVEATAGAPA